MKKKKRKAKKRSPSSFPCDVPDCDRHAKMGWEAGGKKKRICRYHFARHCNSDDPFNLFLVFKIKQFKLDKLGFVEARDQKEVVGRVKQQQVEERKRKKGKSLARLKEWKEENGNRPRPKRRPIPKPRPNKAVVEGEMDDIVGDILNGD